MDEFNLREDTLPKFTKPSAVDREAGKVEGITILGLESLNGRSYKPDALKAAAPIYEGIMVNVDHVDKKSGRKVTERFGKVTGLRFVEGRGLVGDLHYNTDHPWASPFAWFAENMPDAVGPSHDAVGRGRKENGKFIVEEIVSAKSVDIVADPATVKSLYESFSPEEENIEEAELSAAAINNLPDTDFAIILPGGKKDSEGKTTPRSLRKLPIPDAAHVRNALARLDQSDLTPAQKRSAFRKIRTSAMKHKISISKDMMTKFSESTKGGTGLLLTEQQLGKFIRQEREKKNISLASLANSAGIDASTMGQIERGEISEPPDERIRRIANRLGVSFKRLRAMMNPPPKKQKTHESITHGGDDMELNDMTLEFLKENRPDLVSAILLEVADDEETATLLSDLQEENKTLAEENDKLKLQASAAEKAAKVQKAITESKLPDEAISDVFRTQLLESSDDEAMSALIEDRKVLWETSLPESREQGGGTPARGKDKMTKEQFKEAITV